MVLYGILQANGHRTVVLYLVRIKNRNITTRDPRLQIGRIEQRSILYGSCVHFPSGAVRVYVGVEQVRKSYTVVVVVGGLRLWACVLSISSDARGLGQGYNMWLALCRSISGRVG